MKNNLYVNIGNTNTSFAFLKSNNINELVVETIETSLLKSENYKNVIDQTLEKLDCNIDKVYISSVVSSLNEIIEKYFLNLNKECDFISWKNVSFIDLTNLYNPYQLGSDILTQMCYVNTFAEEAIVVSAGTACVVYHIKNGKLSGCIILPGITQSIKTIINTTDIQNIEFVSTDKIMGFNTNEAISIGLVNNIENIVDNIKKKLNIDCPVICSGGDSKYFSRNKWWFIDNLETIGLFIYAQQKNQNK
ncbi:MAG: type III pantothenate kinase [Mycoplasma sp.]|nr:type III pantothenate kinase [Mycoplasma sp.]